MRQTRKQKRSYKRVKWIIGVALVVLVAAMGVMAASHQNKRSGNATPLTTADSHIMHVMIMGVDSRGDDVGRSDTLMVTAVDVDQKKAALLSMDSTMKSNLSVGMPLDLAVIEKDACRVSAKRRIMPADPQFSAAFLAIWLADNSRDPALTRRLRGQP